MILCSISKSVGYMCHFMLTFTCTVYSIIRGNCGGGGGGHNTKHGQKIKLIYLLYTCMSYTFYLRK